MASSPTSSAGTPGADTPSADTAAPAPQIPDYRDLLERPPLTSSSDPPTDTHRCFVCLVDESQASLPHDWSTPCTCSLEGHQDCLLAWVTDLEAQGKEVKCPVCKSPIIVTERWDVAIQFSNYLNRKFSRWSPRILLTFIASGAFVSSSVYGAKAIEWFAGPEATMDFLFKPDEATLFQVMRRGNQYRGPRINLISFAILPLIGPALVLNRLHLGEVVMIPASLLYGSLFHNPNEFLTWPPSPERALALYPALKTAYFQLQTSLAIRLEKRWEAAAARMRISNGATEQAPATRDQYVAPQPQAEAEGGHLLDFEIDIQLGGGGDGEAGDNPAQARRNRALDAAGKSPINFLAGTLLFPGVCYGMGELLRLALPSRFVTRPAFGPSTGLLQERWGRSLVGGCLFVVLKDAFFLYVKYRKMMNRSSRRIKNAENRPPGR
ncbi:hypothetical protein F4779DRAFT_604689 [Xylariaceae sp. FL0662B]|nr:hypothetical protein F4779DRAFT_604689 [Xylariaceae sp. FL0662B]